MFSYHFHGTDHVRYIDVSICALFFFCINLRALFNWLEENGNSVTTENELIILPHRWSTKATIHWECGKLLTPNKTIIIVKIHSKFARKNDESLSTG